MRRIIVTSMLVLSLGAQAGQPEIDRIDDAFMKGDVPSLMKLTKATDGYDQALARYRLAGFHMSQGQMKEGTNELKQAIDIMEALVKKRPENVENWVLLSSACGMILSLEPSSFGEYAPKAGKAMGTAMALDAENPRVQLIRGLSLFHTPVQYGGSKQKALEAFTKAAEAFYSNTEPYWGQAEAYVWLGMTQQELGDNVAAKQSWQKAVEIEPDFQWAKMLLAKK